MIWDPIMLITVMRYTLRWEEGWVIRLEMHWQDNSCGKFNWSNEITVNLMGYFFTDMQGLEYSTPNQLLAWLSQSQCLKQIFTYLCFQLSKRRNVTAAAMGSMEDLSSPVQDSAVSSSPFGVRGWEINGACHWRGYNPGVLYQNQVTATYLKIRHP